MKETNISMKNLIVLFAFLSLLSCSNKKEQPKVIYDQTKSKNQIIKKDTTKIKTADLPIQIEGTNYLLHVLGDLRFNDSKNTYSSGSENLSYTLSNYNRYELTGSFDNIKFQHQDSLTFYALTEKEIKIQTVTYLPTMATKLKKQFLVYTLQDMDSNKDGILDQNDILDLYISESNGKNFIKLSPEFQEVIDWKLIESQNKIYFKTIEDINKNGAFDKNDTLHYYTVNLKNATLISEEYFPFK